MEKDFSDKELIERIQESNCENSLKALIDKHTPLCHQIHKKYYPAMSKSGVFPEDIINDKDYLVYKCALSFKAGKNTKFSTWLGNQMRYLCLNTMNRNKLIATEESQMTFFINKGVDAFPIQAKEYSDFVFNILDQLKDKRVKEVFVMRYFNDSKKKSTWSKIAKSIGVSTQTAINLHDRAIKILKEKTSERSVINSDKI